MVKKILLKTAYFTAGVMLALALMTMFFYAAVNYTFRYNPPAVTEIAQ